MLKFKHAILFVTAASLMACGQSEPIVNTSPAKVAETASVTEVSKSSEVDFSKAPSGTYTLDKNHAYIVFTYVHAGYSTPFLRWKDWDSSLVWDQEDPTKSSVSVDIKVANIDSGVDVFDQHLVGERWFNAAAHPDITFKSTSLTRSSNTTGTMTGDLTVKGITKPVTLDVTFNKAAFDGRSSSHKVGFSAKGSLLRSDFGLGAGAPATSDNVDLIIEAEYAMKGSE